MDFQKEIPTTENRLKAIEKGCQSPVVTFVPIKDMVQIY